MNLNFEKYRRKPVEVSVCKLSPYLWQEINLKEEQRILVNGYIVKAVLINEPKILGTDEDGNHIIDDDYIKCFLVQTLEDVPQSLHRAELDDYLIRGVEGKIYVCKPDIFHKTYEKVKEEQCLRYQQS